MHFIILIPTLINLSWTHANNRKKKNHRNYIQLKQRNFTFNGLLYNIDSMNEVGYIFWIVKFRMLQKQLKSSWGGHKMLYIFFCWFSLFGIWYFIQNVVLFLGNVSGLSYSVYLIYYTAFTVHLVAVLGISYT